MGLFNKKENVPSISPTPTLPQLPKTSPEKVSQLPTLPGDTTNDNLNQEIIKSAVNDITISGQEEFNEGDQIIERMPSLNDTDHSTVAKDETIFVKIDKFNKSQETLHEIGEKISELSTDIQTLKELKTKEIKELTDWDTELKEINLRLSKIDSSIFSEV